MTPARAQRTLHTLTLPRRAPGEESYVALDKGAISGQHVLLLPIEHFPSTLCLPASAAAELERYAEALRACFRAQARPRGRLLNTAAAAVSACVNSANSRGCWAPGCCAGWFAGRPHEQLSSSVRPCAAYICPWTVLGLPELCHELLFGRSGARLCKRTPAAHACWQLVAAASGRQLALPGSPCSGTRLLPPRRPKARARAQGQELFMFERYMVFRKSGGNHAQVNAVAVPASARASAAAVLQGAAEAAGLALMPLKGPSAVRGRLVWVWVWLVDSGTGHEHTVRMHHSAANGAEHGALWSITHENMAGCASWLCLPLVLAHVCCCASTGCAHRNFYRAQVGRFLVTCIVAPAACPGLTMRGRGAPDGSP